MNKIYDNKLVVILFSLVLAIFLFIFVKAERYNNNPVSFFSNINETKIENISEVPVYATGDVDDYYITGIPKTVSVEISGPSSLIDQTLQAKEFKVVTENLANLGEGSHYIQLTLENISKELTYKISPSSVKVDIAKLEAKSYPVEINFNNDQIAPGYEIHKSQVKPNEVTLTGSKENLDKVAHVTVDVSLPQNISTDFQTTAPIIVKDIHGNILNLTSKPNQVTVSVTIGKHGLFKPIHIQIGNKEDGFSYEFTNLSAQQAKLFGDEQVLSSVSSIIGSIDLRGITQTKHLEIPLKLPEGAESIEPQVVEATVIPHPGTEYSQGDSNSPNVSYTSPPQH